MSMSKGSGPDTELAELAKRSYLAYVDKDRAAMERLIAEDFHFTEPARQSPRSEDLFRTLLAKQPMDRRISSSSTRSRAANAST